MDELILFMHLLCILFFFIDNEKIKFRTTDHILQMNGVCAHEVCVLSSLAPNLQSDILSRYPDGDMNS